MDDGLEGPLRRLVDSLAGGWSHGDPVFVDFLDLESCTRPDDLPVRTLGAVLYVSQLNEIPRTSNAEILRFVDAFVAFSREYEVEIEFEMNGDLVGDVRHGAESRTLRNVLFATWQSGWQ